MKTESADIVAIPPDPGSERDPIRSFRVVNSHAMLDCIYEGHGLTLERAIAQETGHFPESDGGVAGPPYDTVIYEGELVAAVIRNFGTGKGTFKVLPIGTEWAWHVNAMDDMDRLEPDDVEEALEAEADEDDDEDDEPDAVTPGERAILKVVRGAGLSIEDACTALGAWVKADDADPMEGIRAVTRFRAERIASKPLAYCVTESDYHIQHYPRRWTEDRVMAEALAEWPDGGPTHDQAVWQGDKLIGVIKAKPDGTAEIVRV